MARPKGACTNGIQNLVKLRFTLALDPRTAVGLTSLVGDDASINNYIISYKGCSNKFLTAKFAKFKKSYAKFFILLCVLCDFVVKKIWIRNPPKAGVTVIFYLLFFSDEP